MNLELSVETVNHGTTTTIVAMVQHGPGGKWYRSEIDIVEPFAPMDLPAALRKLADELEHNLRSAIPAL